MQKIVLNTKNFNKNYNKDSTRGGSSVSGSLSIWCKKPGDMSLTTFVFIFKASTNNVQLRLRPKGKIDQLSEDSS